MPWRRCCRAARLRPRAGRWRDLYRARRRVGRQRVDLAAGIEPDRRSGLRERPLGLVEPRAHPGGERAVLHAAELEFGFPAWVFGASSFAFLDDGRILCVYDRDGFKLLRDHARDRRPGGPRARGRRLRAPAASSWKARAPLSWPARRRCRTASSRSMLTRELDKLRTSLGRSSSTRRGSRFRGPSSCPPTTASAPARARILALEPRVRDNGRRAPSADRHERRGADREDVGHLRSRHPVPARRAASRSWTWTTAGRRATAAHTENG